MSQQSSRVSPTVVGSDGASSSPPIGQYAPAPKFPAPNSDLQAMGQEGSIYGQYPGSVGPSGSSGRYASFSSAGALDGGQPITEDRSTRPAHSSPSTELHNPNILPTSSSYVDNYMEIRSWPPNLPSPAITRHL